MHVYNLKRDIEMLVTICKKIDTWISIVIFYYKFYCQSIFQCRKREHFIKGRNSLSSSIRLQNAVVLSLPGTIPLQGPWGPCSFQVRRLLLILKSCCFNQIGQVKYTVRLGYWFLTRLILKLLNKPCLNSTKKKTVFKSQHYKESSFFH